MKKEYKLNQYIAILKKVLRGIGLRFVINIYGGLFSMISIIKIWRAIIHLEMEGSILKAGLIHGHRHRIRTPFHLVCVHSDLILAGGKFPALNISIIKGRWALVGGVMIAQLHHHKDLR